MKKFTEEHEWLRVEGDLVIVGITAHAAEQLGDVVFVELPELDTQVATGDEVSVINRSRRRPISSRRWMARSLK